MRNVGRRKSAPVRPPSRVCLASRRGCVVGRRARAARLSNLPPQSQVAPPFSVPTPPRPLLAGVAVARRLASRLLREVVGQRPAVGRGKEAWAMRTEAPPASTQVRDEAVSRSFRLGKGAAETRARAPAVPGFPARRRAGALGRRAQAARFSDQAPRQGWSPRAVCKRLLGSVRAGVLAAVRLASRSPRRAAGQRPAVGNAGEATGTACGAPHQAGRVQLASALLVVARPPGHRNHRGGPVRRFLFWHPARSRHLVLKNRATLCSSAAPATRALRTPPTRTAGRCRAPSPTRTPRSPRRSRRG